MVAAWGEGYFPYLYQNRPTPTTIRRPTASSWDLYREMWGSTASSSWTGISSSVEYADRLATIKVPTLITVGDHDECDPSIAAGHGSEDPGSKLVILPKSGHMTFVDQPGMFNHAVDEFLNAPTR